MELIQGCESKQEVSKIQKFISKFHIIWLDAESSNQAVELFAKNKLKSNIGLIDILIAQVSIQSGLALHTFNIKHYKSIPNIELIQPYKK
ncbi:MAG: type II toxin-antitoxin system VapC family toxin [Candidatus Kapabacteria bacterium]|nr:type II toxin-antitoxin system VapC family toxin [Ignavibacteriota bacterium]MCW5883511.1 type II toxin-antitoxin system VapC family toxin [Candidatus Kapabacteria bacterium]